MTRATDGAFWSPVITEGWVACAKGTNVADRCRPSATDAAEITAVADDSFWTPSDESTSDWIKPFDDKDPDDFWCTKANTTKGAALVPYECTKLKCYMERLLDTSDTIKDLKFSPTVDAADTMVINPRRARVYINKSTYATSAMNDNKLELKIPLGADRMLAATLSTVAILVSTLAF